MIKDESLYIAGPLVFYVNGTKMWNAWKLEAEFYGFTVALPNDNKLNFEAGNKRELSAAIFKNCRDSINLTTGIIANLETYRGFVPDGGTIFEVGMAYGRGAKCYAYTRDKRMEGLKYGAATYKGDEIYDLDGRVLPNRHLPFGPCLVGSSKIIEGSFSDVLKVYMADVEEESKLKAHRNVQVTTKAPEVTMPRKDQPIVYLAGFERYDNDAEEKYAQMKAICSKYGLYAITPLDSAPGVEDIETDDPYAKAYNLFDRYQQHVRNCDVILANLNDYHGFEPNDDVAFEAGMAFQLGKKLFAYMDDISPMVNRIPNDGKDEPRDVNTLNVENFEAPLNLMFGASYEIFDGSFEEVVKKTAAALKNFKLRDDLVPPVLD